MHQPRTEEHRPSRDRQQGDTPAHWGEAVAQLVPDLLCLCVAGEVHYVNGAGMRILGATPADVLGRPFIDFVHAEYRGLGSRLPEALAEEGRALPLKLIAIDGRAVDVEVMAWSMPEEDGAFPVLVYARDITERLRAADEVLRSEKRYRRLVEQALDLICVCDDGRVTFINAAGARMLGEEGGGAVLGRRLVDLVHADYRDLVADGLAAFAEEDGALPMKFLRADGAAVDAEVGVMRHGPGESYMIEARDITERLRSAESLREREQHLRGIMDTVVDGIVTTDRTGIVLSFNPAAEKIFGYSAGEVVGRNVSMLMPEPYRSGHDGYMASYLETGRGTVLGYGREVTGLRKDGGEFPIELALSELRRGHDRTFIGVVRDITERKRAEEDLRRAHDELEQRVEERTVELTQEIAERRRAEEKLRLAATVIETTSEGVLVLDGNFKVTDVNPAFTAISGYRRDEVLGGPPPFHMAISRDSAMLDAMWQNLEAQGHWEAELWNVRKSGERYAERVSISAISGEDGGLQHYAVLISDITKRKQDEERIRYQANYDTLTGLPNRSLFQDRLGHTLAAARRMGKKSALIFIDLDGFKLVNDTLGHDMGDMLLQEAARRLTDSVRSIDTVARLGGDEFTVILAEIDQEQSATIVAQRILDALAKPFHLKNHEAFVSGSLGITVFPDDASEPAGLLKNADAAMYRAKEQGKANYQFFTNDMNAEAKERLSLKNGLRRAIDRNEFVLHYQPKLDLATNEVTGVEALIRWMSPDKGLVSPVRFIPMLEETGLIVEVGEWALREACRQHHAWLDAGLPFTSIAVNLSARQLRQAGFTRQLADILGNSGISPGGLEVEITESMLMADTSRAVETLNEIHELGLRISMDDFGTGYSSLSYLKRFAIDTIKIDRSFVADITANPDDAQIIKTIITMGQTLNRKVVAEGVETEQQLSMLRSYRCDEVQGYYISRPLTADDLGTFLRDWHAERLGA